MMKKTSKRIGEILIEKGWITEGQLHDALLDQKIGDKFLGSILVEKGWLDEKKLAEALSVQFGIPVVDLKAQYIDMELARKFSSSLIIDHKCFPLREDEDAITVAIINPLNAVAISKLEEEARPREVKFVLATEQDIKEVIQSYRKFVSENIQRLLKRNKPQDNN